MLELKQYIEEAISSGRTRTGDIIKLRIKQDDTTLVEFLDFLNSNGFVEVREISFAEDKRKVYDIYEFRGGVIVRFTKNSNGGNGMLYKARFVGNDRNATFYDISCENNGKLLMKSYGYEDKVLDYITEYVSSGRSRNRIPDPSDVITGDDLIMFLDSLNYVRNDSVNSATDMLEEEGNIYRHIERRGTRPSFVLVRVEDMDCVYALYTYGGDDDCLYDCYWYKGRRNGYRTGSTTAQYALKMIHDYARY